MYEWSFDEFLMHSNKIRLQHDLAKLEEEEQRREEALANPTNSPYNR